MLGVVGADADTPDVMADAGGEVDPAEAERAVHGVQRGEQARALGDEHVPFEPGLHGCVALRERVADGGLGVAPQHVHACVQPVDEFLLVQQFIVGRCLWCPLRCTCLTIPLPAGYTVPVKLSATQFS